MAFADDFVQCMSQYGVTVDPGSLPDENTLQQAIDYALQWLNSLDQQSQQGLDAATYDPGSASIVLADGSVNVAPALSGLLNAFDQVSGSLSQLLGSAQQCVSTALQSSSGS